MPRGSTLLHLSALAQEPWIGGGFDSAWFRIVRQAWRELGFTPAITVGSDDYQAVLAFVAAGIGVAVVPGLAAAMPPPGVVVRALRGDAPARRICVVAPRDAFPLAAAQSMVALLSKAARGFRPPRPDRVALPASSR